MYREITLLFQPLSSGPHLVVLPRCLLDGYRCGVADSSITAVLSWLSYLDYPILNILPSLFSKMNKDLALLSGFFCLGYSGFAIMAINWLFSPDISYTAITSLMLCCSCPAKFIATYTSVSIVKEQNPMSRDLWATVRSGYGSVPAGYK